MATGKSTDLDSKVDITGLGTPQVEEWEEKAKALAKPEHFAVFIEVSDDVLNHLSTEEKNRLHWKLELVAFAARALAAGMLKGTIKYPNDQYGVERWMKHIMSEGADFFNYIILMFNEFHGGKHG